VSEHMPKLSDLYANPDPQIGDVVVLENGHRLVCVGRDGQTVSITDRYGVRIVSLCEIVGVEKR